MPETNELDPRLQIGGNNPPSLAEILKETHASLFAALDELKELANGAPKEIADDKQAAAVAELAADGNAIWKKLDAARVAEKAPFLKGQREVDGTFREPLELADAIDKRLMKRVTVYNNAKAARARQAQLELEATARKIAEDARLAAEDAMKAGRTEDAMADLADASHAEDRADDIAQAAPSIADQTRIQTDSGLTIGTRAEWTFEITDYDAIPLDKLRQLIKRDAIEAALRQFVKNGNREIAGVRIYEDHKATRRRA